MATPKEQLQAMASLQENWDGYGAAAPKPQALELAHEFVDLLEAMLKNAAPEGSCLSVSPTRIGGVLIEWEDRATEHEIEIDPDRSVGFLHRNKRSGQIDTRKFSPIAQAVVHPGLLHELRLLLAA